MLYDWLFSVRHRDVPVLIQHKTVIGGGVVALSPAEASLPGTPQEAVVDPNSRYCCVFVLPKYVDELPVKTNKIIVVRCAIQADGTLGRCSQQTFTAPEGLFSPVFDPPGRTLYLLTRRSVLACDVGPDGSIAPTTPYSIHAGRGPLGLVYVQR